MTDRELLEKLVDQMDNMETKLDGLKDEIGEVRKELRNTIGEVRQELKDVKQELRDEIGEVRLVLENETRNNISIIAEGHLDLVRKLDEANKAGIRVENIGVRTNVLETKVRQIIEQTKVS